MNKKEVFISYSWDNDAHNEKVISFTDYLRDNGFYAQIDIMYSQEETAVDFKKMMHKAMTDYEKVIVVLSSGYKNKAENFKGGVGTEYSLILKDIDESRNKYILVSFGPINKDIIPLGFRDREVLDLSIEENYNSLFAKLMNEKIIPFKNVRDVKPTIIKKEVPAFVVPQDTLTIEKLVAKMSNSHSQIGLLKEIHFDLNLFVKNNSLVTIPEITIETSYPLWLTDYNLGGYVDGDTRTVTTDEKSKLYSNQTKSIHLGEIVIKYYDAAKIDASSIKVKIFSELGIYEKEFLLSDILIYKTQYGQNENLSPKHFTGRD